MDRVLKINNKMYALLVDTNMNNFTVQELRSRYHTLGLSTANSKQDRQFLYRQLFMLESKGLLIKEGTSYSREIKYQKTDLFNQSVITPKNPDLQVSSSHCEQRALPKLADLKKTLTQYQIKFVSSLGESEEYQDMLEKFPCMSGHIEKYYYQTRENSTKYLGKINALKKIIQGYPG